MKYYKTRYNGWGKDIIEEIEVEKETESSVWINGRRNAKESSYENYFPSREKAKEFLIRMADASISSLEERVAKHRKLKETYLNL